jgi:spermidine/putrescine-binding protein
MKKLLPFIILLVGIIMSCKKYDDYIKELGTKAANEFCDCYKNNSKDDCLEKLTSKYNESDYMDKKFIEAFNKQSVCGIELEIIYLSAGKIISN